MLIKECNNVRNNIQGRAEGAEKQAIEATINLLKMKKLTPEEIALVENLPIEKVLELQKSLTQ